MTYANESAARPRAPGPRDASGEGRVHTGESPPAIEVSGVGKTYKSGHKALDDIDLRIHPGEIFALLGPNGAGKTTLINIICGIVTASAGRVRVEGHDIVSAYRAARGRVGLVPQELTTDAFESVWATVRFSRGLFGKPPDPAHLERVLRSLTLWDKRNAKLMTLSGGMKRRVLIAKALAHEPSVLFLDEPSAGVDVDLRREMWEVVQSLRASGVTIILTTHYIDEAEQLADRIGVINKGRLVLAEDKVELMRKLGKKRLTLQLQEPLDRLPERLHAEGLELGDEGHELIYSYDTRAERTGIAPLLASLHDLGIRVSDVHTEQSSLEEIFVGLVREQS